MAKKGLERKLPPAVAKKYTVKTIRPGKFVFAGFGEIDLRTISVKKADELYASKFPYLILNEAEEEQEEDTPPDNPPEIAE